MLLSFGWQRINAFPSMLTRQKGKAFNDETQFVFSLRKIFSLMETQDAHGLKIQVEGPRGIITFY